MKQVYPAYVFLSIGLLCASCAGPRTGEVKSESEKFDLKIISIDDYIGTYYIKGVNESGDTLTVVSPECRTDCTDASELSVGGMYSLYLGESKYTRENSGYPESQNFILDGKVIWSLGTPLYEDDRLCGLCLKK